MEGTTSGAWPSRPYTGVSVCPQIGPEPGSSHLLLAFQAPTEVSKGTAPKFFEALGRGRNHEKTTFVRGSA